MLAVAIAGTVSVVLLLALGTLVVAEVGAAWPKIVAALTGGAHPVRAVLRGSGA